MRDVAVVSFSQAPNVRRDYDRNEVEILSPVLLDVRDKVGLTKADIEFVISGSSDYLAGCRSVSSGPRRIWAWPPISESHVEMDGAWALYEAWVKLLTGEIDTALVYAFGKSSLGNDVTEVLTLQQDPYLVAPLWPDSVSMAALQARALLDGTEITAEDMAAVAVRDRKKAKANPNAQISGDYTVEGILAEPYVVSPLHRSDCPPISDGACSVILAAGDRARELVERPAWIKASTTGSNRTRSGCAT